MLSSWMYADGLSNIGDSHCKVNKNIGMICGEMYRIWYILYPSVMHLTYIVSPNACQPCLLWMVAKYSWSTQTKVILEVTLEG